MLPSHSLRRCAAALPTGRLRVHSLAMPFISITTNRPQDVAASAALMQTTQTIVSQITGKPTAYVMVTVKTDTPIRFGDSEEPAAWVEVKALDLKPEAIPELATKIPPTLAASLGIPEERIFLIAQDVPRGAWAMGRKVF